MIHLKPISLREANAYVAEHHRHHPPSQGCRYVTSVRDAEGKTRGVVIVSWPRARMSHDGFTAEVVRLCTDGTANACTMLLGAARRAARALGFTRLVTYTLPEEGGASLRAAGWRHAGITGGGEWSRPSRHRRQSDQPQQKSLWEGL